MDNTHKEGLSVINTIAASPNVMECIKGCRLMETTDIMLSDHYSYLIDFNIKRYFGEQLSG